MVSLRAIPIILGISLIIALFMTQSALALHETPSKQVLVLVSYNPGQEWEEDIISEIKLRFAMHMVTTEIATEYMDTKRINSDEARLAYLEGLYREKYKDRHFDLLIAADTDAFNFLLRYRDILFPKTPVVFCGVVYFSDEMLKGKIGFTGVVEAYDVNDTITLMLHLHPETQKIAIITDQTTTGQAARKNLDEVISSYENRVSFEYLDNLSTGELQERLATLPEKSLILLMTFNRDRLGTILTY